MARFQRRSMPNVATLTIESYVDPVPEKKTVDPLESRIYFVHGSRIYWTTSRMPSMPLSRWLAKNSSFLPQ